MPNTPVRAAATGLPNSRRAVLRSILAAGAVATVPAAAVAAETALTSADQRALDLWKRHRKLLTIRDRFHDQWKAADARLPSWARPGPKYAFPDGRLADELAMAGWPMVANPEQQPVENGMILVRPQVEDFYARFGVRWREDGSRETARRELTRSLVAHEERLAQQKAEMDRVGYSDAAERLEHATDVLSALEEEIKDHADVSVLALAGTLMVEIRIDPDDLSTPLFRASLAAIRPQLVDAIAEDADKALATSQEGANV